jgi:hypothetical protein
MLTKKMSNKKISYGERENSYMRRVLYVTYIVRISHLLHDNARLSRIRYVNYVNM